MAPSSADSLLTREHNTQRCPPGDCDGKEHHMPFRSPPSKALPFVRRAADLHHRQDLEDEPLAPVIKKVGSMENLVDGPMCLLAASSAFAEHVTADANAGKCGQDLVFLDEPFQIRIVQIRSSVHRVDPESSLETERNLPVPQNPNLDSNDTICMHANVIDNAFQHILVVF